MAGKQASGAKHQDCFHCPPESLVVVTDKNSPFYDDRVEKPVPEYLIRSIMKHGVIKPVAVMRDGENFVVDDGRQRTRGLIEANKRLVAAGKPPKDIKYILLQSLDGDAGVIGLSAAANLHVEDSPMSRARKARRMLDAGATEEDVALDFGVESVQAVRNWLELLDLATPLQKAVDDDVLSEAAARVLSKLDRESQKTTFEQMLKEGTLKGAEAQRAVSAVKKGKAVPKKGSAKRMKNRVILQEVFDRLKARDGNLKRDTKESVLPFLEWVLGDKKAEGNLPDDVLEVVTEMAAAKKPVGRPATAKKQRAAA